MSCTAAVESPHPILTDDLMTKYPGGCPFVGAPLTAVNSDDGPMNDENLHQKDEEDEAELFKEFHSKNTE
jgi:hypothetical protein